MHTKLTTLVDRGLQLYRQIEADQKELKQIEKELRAYALTGDQQPLNDPTRDGRQFLAQGTIETVPIVLTADILYQSFADGSIPHLQAASIAGMDLDTLYHPVRTWKMLAKSGKALRAEAVTQLGAHRAAQFITAVTQKDKDGIPKSQIRTEWDRATQSVPSVQQVP